MYHIYHSRAYVLQGSPSGEANRSFLLFTRELGMVYASAQGVRLSQSKLRGHLRSWSEIDASMVRGKSGWRLVGAIEKKYYFPSIETKPELLIACGHLLKLLERLMPGEGPHLDLYDCIIECLNFASANNLDSNQIKNFECVMALKILLFLGYLPEIPNLSKFYQPVALSQHLLDEMGMVRALALAEINKSLKESQL